MDTVRTCYKCKLTKILSEFVNRKDKPLGKDYVCHACNNKILSDWKHSHPDRVREINRDGMSRWRKKSPEKAKAASYRWREKHPRRYRDLRIKGRYGLEVGAYDKILGAQGGGCAICKRSEPGGHGGFHVDHCHVTNKVRGLLCAACNLSIGKFKHDPAILQAAIDYLTRNPDW